MSKKVKVSKIKIEIGENEFELTLEQARELRDLLEDTFGKTIYQPYPITNPIIVERPIYTRPYRYWEPTWTYTSGTTAISSGSVSSGSVTYSLNDSGSNAVG